MASPVAADELGNDVGTRSVHNGAQQRERQLWLHERADQLRAYSGDAESPGNGEDSANVGGENSGEGNASPERGEADAGEDGAEVVSIEERLHRMERGVELWGATYVPPIAPDERRGLLEKWTAPAGGGVGERVSRGFMCTVGYGSCALLIIADMNDIRPQVCFTLWILQVH